MTSHPTPPSFFKQFGRPKGRLGRIAGISMALRNGEANRWALDLAAVAPADRVLDLGCGPGVGIAEAAARATEGFVAGVDPSPAVVRPAARRERGAGAGGH